MVLVELDRRWAEYVVEPVVCVCPLSFTELLPLCLAPFDRLLEDEEAALPLQDAFSPCTEVVEELKGNQKAPAHPISIKCGPHFYMMTGEEEPIELATKICT